MELEELEKRLLPFSRFHYEDESVEIIDVFRMPGHAGFSYGFGVKKDNNVENWYIRLPPPGVKLQGTADVLRQVAVLNVLPDSIPHCRIKWSGDDLYWFGSPYFVVEKLEGDVVRSKADWVRSLAEETRVAMARQAIQAMVDIHRLDPTLVPYLGQSLMLENDVHRWDRFAEKAAEPAKLKLVPEIKRLLLSHMPRRANVGIFHGDFQWSNLFYCEKGGLLAVIDWELVGIGSTLNDIGWFATFNDPEAWNDADHNQHIMPRAKDLIAMYEEAWGEELAEISWFRALAAYKFAIITGFNLMLHRRGKRYDPAWETTKDSTESLLHRAYSLLTE
ncbi:MAG: phosphotransferase family protein [Gammaproteobacteria bacterium]|nr:phosphotransferase family protein [Gammaproteobacteria bacterium]